MRKIILPDVLHVVKRGSHGGIAGKESNRLLLGRGPVPLLNHPRRLCARKATKKASLAGDFIVVNRLIIYDEYNNRLNRRINVNYKCTMTSCVLREIVKLQAWMRFHRKE